MSDKTCKWNNKNTVAGIGIWETSCQAAYYLGNDNEPNDNDYFYCPHCGKKIEVLDVEQ